MGNFEYGFNSKKQLATVDRRLVRILNHALNYGILDWSIIKGYRGEVEQNEAFNSGDSKVEYPNSKHNSSPSLAIDFIPHPFRGWDKIHDFVAVAMIILVAAEELEIPVRWGGMWQGHGPIMPEGAFNDLGHLELV